MRITSQPMILFHCSIKCDNQLFYPVFINQLYKSLGFSVLNEEVTVHTLVYNRVFIDPLVFGVHNVEYNFLGDCLEIFSASKENQ